MVGWNGRVGVVRGRNSFHGTSYNEKTNIVLFLKNDQLLVKDEYEYYSW